MKVRRIAGSSAEVIRLIGPYAMDPHLIRQRGNLPIITKDTYIWHVLKDGKKVKAFVAMEILLGGNIKLQSFVEVEANKQDLRLLIKDVIEYFRKTERHKLTASVLKDFVDIFVAENFEVVKHKKNWTDLAYIHYQYEAAG
ncbi:hypothetical protein [[Flexibacter] sp. ATCC 35208]|uniref:hypothetical protein n=1 Tax=[Flexibacter] sp. ATCC 35208 TaxID=1936242 RepID=UPI0009CD02B6|nr:hypothetical protein [[Flexibacter] sp. ATCC 35208]OMP80033.1 hypothetical protein BW716_05950 [[Flexibacter] sp. ATCC 35208]